MERSYEFQEPMLPSRALSKLNSARDRLLDDIKRALATFSEAEPDFVLRVSVLVKRNVFHP
jgi:hypothetical protein